MLELLVLTSVKLRRFVRVMFCMQMMCMCEMGMLRSLIAVAGLVVLGGFVMVLGGMLVVLSRVFMVFCCFMVWHRVVLHRRGSGCFMGPARFGASNKLRLLRLLR